VMADVGTGSGCVAVTLVLESRIRNLEVSIMATDISGEALSVARRNAERHGVADVIEWLEGDLLEPLRGRQVDMIVSNPPYVPSAELGRAGDRRETLGLTFEPRAALDGGANGLQYIEELQRTGRPVLLETQGGRLARAGKTPDTR